MFRYHTLLVLAALVAPTAGLVLRDVDQTEAATTPDDTGVKLQKMIDDYFVEMGWQAPAWYERPAEAGAAPYTTTTKPPTVEDLAHTFLAKVKRLRELAWAMVFLFDVGHVAEHTLEKVQAMGDRAEQFDSEKQTALEDATNKVNALKARHANLYELLDKADHAKAERAMGVRVAKATFEILNALAPKLEFLVPDADIDEMIEKSHAELMAAQAALEKATSDMNAVDAKMDEFQSQFKAAFHALPEAEVEAVVAKKIHEAVLQLLDLASTIYPAFTDGLQMKEAEKIVQIFNQINEVTHVRDVEFNKTYIDPQLQSKIDIQTEKSKAAHLR